MRIDIMMKINQDINQKRYLRENSYWYKYLNRDINYYKIFLDEMKEKYKLTPADKINKFAMNINTLKTFLDVLK